MRNQNLFLALFIFIASPACSRGSEEPTVQDEQPIIVASSTTAEGIVTAAIPIATKPVTLVDVLFNEHMHIYDRGLDCTAMKELLTAVNSIGTATTSFAETKQACMNGPIGPRLEALYRVYYGHLCDMPKWNVVWYHLTEGHLWRYLTMCGSFTVIYAENDRRETRELAVLQLSDDRTPFDIEMERLFGEAAYPGLSDPNLAADHLLRLGRIPDLSESREDILAFEAYYAVVHRQLASFGLYDGQTLRMPAKFLDYTDRFMPHIPAKWSGALGMIFESGICSKAIPLARRQKSLTLWLQRRRDEPSQADWEDQQALPEHVNAFCQHIQTLKKQKT